MTMEWTPWLFGFAEHASKKSKDSTQVGAALIGPNRECRLTSFNGPPIGVLDLPERRERPAKYLFASHAEQNLIAFAARAGIRTEGCAVYVTHHPCADCAKSLIQAGIAKVFYKNGDFSAGSAMFEQMEASRTMFAEAGVICQEIV